MKPALRLTVIAITAVMIVALARPVIVQAEDSSLCAYWQPNITKWADLITQYATDNGLDPNLVAAVIEEESKGNPNLVSTAGAVGLLQIMPYEAGFTWRPRAAVLRKPAANLEWGTNTLNEIIRQAQGRITLAVMAYNSGWDRIQLRSTRLFAAKVFDHYARCILSQSGADYKNVSDYTAVHRRPQQRRNDQRRSLPLQRRLRADDHLRSGIPARRSAACRGLFATRRGSHRLVGGGVGRCPAHAGRA